MVKKLFSPSTSGNALDRTLALAPESKGYVKIYEKYEFFIGGKGMVMCRLDLLAIGLLALVLVVDLVGCSPTITPDPLDQVQAVVSVPYAQPDSIESVKTVPQEPTDIFALVARIDSIYELQGYLLDTQTVKLSDPRPYHLLMFDRHSASGYFEYLTFSFL